MPAGGQPQRAEQLFERLYTVCKADAATFNCLVQVYCQLGKHREAINVLEVILRGGQHVELAAFDAAITACWCTGVVPLQQYALQLFDRARQQGLYQLQVTEQVSTRPTGLSQHTLLLIIASRYQWCMRTVSSLCTVDLACQWCCALHAYSVFPKNFLIYRWFSLLLLYCRCCRCVLRGCCWTCSCRLALHMWWWSP